MDAMDESDHLLKLRALLAPKAPDEAPTKKRKAEEVEGPDWTSRYCVVDAAAALTPLDALAVPLAPPMAEALKKNGFDPLFPIQAMVIPLLLKSAETADDEDSAYCLLAENPFWPGVKLEYSKIKCCDVCVSAPTGQGKTLAYAVPIVQVPLFDYIGADLQLKSGETLKTHLALSGVVEVALGIPFIFELVMPIEGVFGMYLDFGAGTVAQPYKILESLVSFNDTAALQWAVVVQVALRPQLAILGFEFNFPVSAQFQVLWKTSGSGGLHFYMSGTLYHATSLSQLIGGLPDLGVACTVDFFPKAVKDSPFCNAEDTMEDEPEVGIYFTVESGKTVADVRAWGMWLAIKVDSTSGSLTLCKDGECSQEFCIWDSQCIPGYHCCKSTLEFTCQKIYKHSLLGTDLSCLELPAAQAAGYAVDPECAGACDETSAALRRAGTVTAVMTLILLFLKW